MRKSVDFGEDLAADDYDQDLAADTAVRVAPGLCLRFVLTMRGMMLKVMVMMMVMAKMMTVMRVKLTTVKRF